MNGGTDLPVGYAVSIAVSGRETLKLPAPYSDCQDSNKEAQKLFELVDGTNINFTYYDIFQEDGYDINTCYSTCLQR